MLFLTAAALLIPPPLPGDDRHAILVAVDRLLDGLTAGSRERVDSVLEEDGTFTVVDMRKPGGPSIKVTPIRTIRSQLKPNTPPFIERISNATVLQRGDIAQVWAPYVFVANGKRRHCGIDNFMLVRREGNWKIGSVSYTVEPLDQCEALGAPRIGQ